MAAKLGILAGGGPLPGYIIEACRSSGRDHFVLAFQDQADPTVIGDAPQAWVRLGAVEEAIGRLRAEECVELVLAGPVRRPTLAELRPDRRAARFLARGILNKGDNGLLGAVVRTLEEEEGFRVVGADALLADLRANAGPLGRHTPTAEDEQDIARGVEVIYQIGKLDIGQATVVRGGVVLGVEAAEGTEALLNRCGKLQRGERGGVLVKLAKPGQEKRADMPVVGPNTVAGAAAAGLAGIAVAAGATLVFEPDTVVADADAAGLFVVGILPSDYLSNTTALSTAHPWLTGNGRLQRSLHIFVIVGEPSGDVLGARLMAAFNAKLGRRVRYSGVGGPQMADQGLDSLFDYRQLAVMGLLEVLPQAPRLLRRVRDVAAAIERDNPDVIISIDAPSFAFAVLRRLGAHSQPRIHYVAPQIWAWRPKRVRKFKKYLGPHFGAVSLPSRPISPLPACHVPSSAIRSSRISRRLRTAGNFAPAITSRPTRLCCAPCRAAGVPK